MSKEITLKKGNSVVKAIDEKVAKVWKDMGYKEAAPAEQPKA